MHVSFSSCLMSFCALSAAASVHHRHPLHPQGTRNANPRDSVMSYVEDTSSSKVPGYRTIGYYVNWAIYARSFFPSQVPASRLTHLHYAFANVNNVTGEVYLTDEYADEQKLFPGDVQTNGTNLYGCMGQVYKLKKGNRNLKTLLSIGGWSYRTNFPTAAATPATRTTFAKTAVSLLKNYGFDGIDVDWEYPDGEINAVNFVKLLQSIRDELDDYASTLEGNAHFLLTGAFPAGPQHYRWIRFPEIDKIVDYWVLMAYDYATSASNSTGYLANLYRSENNPQGTPYNSEQAIEAYISGGATPEKITVGMPLYGRAFAHTLGMGKRFNGTGPGSFEAGVWDYKALPLAGSAVIEDMSVGGAYCYSPAPNTTTLVSYDTPNIARQKAEYLQWKGLGGATWWETSGDFPCTDPNSLIDVVVTTLGGTSMQSLQQTPSWLSYPDSKFENLKHMMGNQSLAGACPLN